MLLVNSALRGYAIAAEDGGLGTVSDFLFDDATWNIRWLVVDTGGWLASRKVLIHPSAIGKADYMRQELTVHLTRTQVEQSPDINHDLPVSQQMESNLYDYYGWDPLWGGGGYFGDVPLGVPNQTACSPAYADASVREPRGEMRSEDGDPHLRSTAAVTGYHIHATDGAIGHLENFVIDADTWSIRYLVVDTRNWWAGQHVLISPYAVQEIDWSERQVRLDLTRDRIKASPPWNPAELIDEAYEKRLHGYYSWPGYGWF